ncbi:hypothetical protein CURE108131_09770 [Cupriavidus respiraculi]|uniref:Lipoprotein n=1 Tax=Cupriavidus respiraculi TaxID=195930 RepID=A0ABN7Y6E7_9BURK|nr:hypothetical protein [Cupriavidus respiraculi]CAG9168964.1 hypothetical protein LMG21510_01302 [Cupriavidus respiraculi]
MTTFRRIALAVAMATGLAACGGGGDDDDSFRLSGSANGAAVKTLTDGQSTTLDIVSGQELRFTSTSPVTWTATAEKTTVTQRDQSSSVWSAALKSPEGGKVTLVARSTANASKTATIVINVPAHRYTAKAIKTGEAITFREVGTLLDGSALDSTYTQTTTAVDTTTGIATLRSVDSVLGLTDIYTQDADRNRLTRTVASNGNLCNFTPKRDYQNFPLYVGKTWQSSWQYSCAAGYRENAAVTAEVQAFEPVMVGATSHDALRIGYKVSYTKSNDFFLTGGPVGNASYQLDNTCWWATDLGRVIKCTFSYTYDGAQPANYRKQFTQMALDIKTVD